MKALTDDALASKIERHCASGDRESDHWNADVYIIEQLKALGFSESVKAWEKVRKWYA